MVRSPAQFARHRLNLHLLLSLFLAATVVTLGGLAGTRLIVPTLGWSHGATTAGKHADTWEGRFVRWDSGYYLRIAQTGYRADGAERAFFPLYPLLVRLTSAMLGLSILWSGWIVSAGCFLASAHLLHRLVLFDFQPKIARRSVLWLCCFPTSFYFFAFYPEALYLLGSMVSIYFARQGNFIASGLGIALASATRPFAFLLAIPFGIEFLLQRDFRRSSWFRFLGGAALAPLGLCAYLLFLSLQAGGANPITIYSANLATHWETESAWPWITIRDAVRAALFGAELAPGWFSRALAWQDLLYALLGFALAGWALRHLRPSLSLYMLGSMLFFVSSHGPDGYVLESMPRHVASIVPIYLVFACAQGHLPQRVRWIPIALSLSLLSLLSAWFASGRWVA